MIELDLDKAVRSIVWQQLWLCASVGGEERSQVVGGDVTAVDLDRLDPGAQYEVQVMALVQNREGTPVSVRVTTREYCVDF